MKNAVLAALAILSVGVGLWCVVHSDADAERRIAVFCGTVESDDDRDSRYAVESCLSGGRSSAASSSSEDVADAYRSRNVQRRRHALPACATVFEHAFVVELCRRDLACRLSRTADQSALFDTERRAASDDVLAMYEQVRGAIAAVALAVADGVRAGAGVVVDYRLPRWAPASSAAPPNDARPTPALEYAFGCDAPRAHLALTTASADGRYPMHDWFDASPEMARARRRRGESEPRREERRSRAFSRRLDRIYDTRRVSTHATHARRDRALYVAALVDAVPPAEIPLLLRASDCLPLSLRQVARRLVYAIDASRDLRVPYVGLDAFVAHLVEPPGVVANSTAPTRRRWTLAHLVDATASFERAAARSPIAHSNASADVYVASADTSRSDAHSAVTYIVSRALHSQVPLAIGSVALDCCDCTPKSAAPTEASWRRAQVLAVPPASLGVDCALRDSCVFAARHSYEYTAELLRNWNCAVPDATVVANYREVAQLVRDATISERALRDRKRTVAMALQARSVGLAARPVDWHPDRYFDAIVECERHACVVERYLSASLCVSCVLFGYETLAELCAWRRSATPRHVRPEQFRLT